MKKRAYLYNASGNPVDSKGNFQSLKSESVDVLRHRLKLLRADLWRNRKVRPALVEAGNSKHNLLSLERAVQKIQRCIEKVKEELIRHSTLDRK